MSDAGVPEKEKDEGRCEDDTWSSGIDNVAPYWARGPQADCIIGKDRVGQRSGG